MSPAHLDTHERHGVLTGGVLLAALAGYVNAVVLTRYSVPVSHMSGAVSRLGGALAEGQGAAALTACVLVGAFFVGATASGVFIGSSAVQVGRRYGMVLMVEGAVLGAATLAIGAHPVAGAALAALACGLQNAMASSYRGLVLRTTHMTGILTDLGLLAGLALRGQTVEGWRAVFLAALLVGFAGGGIAGAWAEVRLGVPALGLAAAVCTAGGAAYFAWRHAALRGAVPGQGFLTGPDGS